MKSILKCILFFMLIGICGNVAADEKGTNQSSLDGISTNTLLPSYSASKEVSSERWPQRSKDILVIALRNDIPPMSFQDVDGNPSGLFVDMWRLWAKKTGRKIELLSGSFKDSMEAFKTGRADVFMALTYSDERSEWMVFSQPVYEFDLCLFFLKNETKALSMQDLKGQKLGLIGGTHLEEQLHKRYPDVEIVSFISIEDMIRAAREGKIRAFVSTPAITSLKFNQLGLVNEFASNEKDLFVRKVSIGILKENENLLSIVDKGFDLISNEELAEIEKQWIEDSAKRYYNAPTPSNEGRIRFTAAEEAWLRTHRTLPIDIPEVFRPLAFIGENKQMQGIIPDYLELFSRLTGIRFQPVQTPPAGLSEPLTTRSADVATTFMGPPSNGLSRLSDPWFTSYWVIVNRTGAPLLRGIQDLTGRKVAVVEHMPNLDELKRDFPGITFSPANSEMDAMQSVLNGNADAFIGTFVGAAYMIQEGQFANLKIAGCTSCEDFSFKFAVRGDWPELVSILNKVIHAVPSEEKDQIFHKWLPIRFEHAVVIQNIIKWIAGGVGVLVMITGMMLFWNRRLAKEIGQRARAENALRDSEKKAQFFYKQEKKAVNKLRDAEEKYRTIFENAAEGIHQTTRQGQFLTINPAFAKILSYDSPEDLMRSITDIGGQLYLSGEERLRHLQLLEEKGSIKNFQTQLYRKDGSICWVDISSRTVCDSSGTLLYYEGFVQDITERKRAQDALQTALTEKEILLKEVHHRVKNNLMAIMGLVDMQGQAMDIEPAKSALKELCSRIRSMALVHEQLYQSQDFSRIDFQGYLESLITHLRSSYEEQRDIGVTVNAAGIEMCLDSAIPCGLLITELVTNAFKYAFPAGRHRAVDLHCEITVEVRRDGESYTLTVADNGIGMPAGMDWTKAETLGLQLVRMLGEHQLQGRIEMNQTDGTMFRLRFSPMSQDTTTPTAARAEG